jgi:hypothetical protein
MNKNKLYALIFFSVVSLCCHGSQQDSILTSIQLKVIVENASAGTTYKWNAYNTSSINIGKNSNYSPASDPVIQAFIQPLRRNFFESESQKIGPGETQTRTTNISISATDTIVRAMLAINNKEHPFSVAREAGKTKYSKKFVIGRIKK